jgi:hypothetical protein
MTVEEKEIDQEILSHIESILEKNIYNFSLESSEDLLDEESDLTLRALKWSRGDKEWWVIVSPFAQIRWTSKNAPRDLIIQISNNMVEVMLGELWKKEQRYERKNEEI